MYWYKLYCFYPKHSNRQVYPNNVGRAQNFLWPGTHSSCRASGLKLFLTLNVIKLYSSYIWYCKWDKNKTENKNPNFLLC